MGEEPAHNLVPGVKYTATDSMHVLCMDDDAHKALLRSTIP